MTKINVLAAPLYAEQLTRIRAFGYGWLALAILLPGAAVVGAYYLAGTAGQVAALITLIVGLLAYVVTTPRRAETVTRFYLFAASPIKPEQRVKVLELIARFPELAGYVDAAAGQGRRLSEIELAALYAYAAKEETKARFAEFLSMGQGASPSDAPSLQEARNEVATRWREYTNYVFLLSAGFAVGGGAMVFSLDRSAWGYELAELFAWCGVFLLVFNGASTQFWKSRLYVGVTSQTLPEIEMIKALNPEGFTRYVGAVHAQGRELMRSELAGLHLRYLKEKR